MQMEHIRKNEDVDATFLAERLFTEGKYGT